MTTTHAETRTMSTTSIEAHSCAARRSYLVHFEGPDSEARAIEWMRERYTTHAFYAIEGHEYSEAVLLTIDPDLYGTCSHGMALWLCADPVSHYPRGI